MGASQPSGAPSAGPMPGSPGWPTPPVGSMPPVPPTGTFTYPGQPWPVTQPGWSSGEMFTQQGMPGAAPPPFGAPSGAYAPGFGVPAAPAPGSPAGPVFGPTLLKRPLPRWFTVGTAVLVAVGLVLIWLTGTDWANGAVRAGIAALVVGVIVLGVFLFRFSQGYRATRAVSLAMASVLILLVLGGAGLGLQNPIHSLQGTSLAGQQNFDTAIQEFQAAGDNVGIARTYIEWGQQLLNQHRYQVPADPTQQATDGTKPDSAGAINKFEVVLNQYKSLTDQVTQAQEGEANAYLAWGDQYLNQSSYTNAVATFKDAIDKKAELGNTSAFPKIHAEAAKAYYALGQQQITSDQSANSPCTDAVQTYQILVKDYSDTQSGQMASSDLKKPQNVTGVVVNRQTGQPAAHVKLFLSAHWQLSSSGFTASDDYVTTSDANGNFTFANIAPSDTKYLISYIGTGGGEEITVSTASGQPENVVQVMSLCTTDAGTVLQF
jgi:hypothetical protein